MSERSAEHGANGNLAVQAFLYYCGELEPRESAAFERLLGEREEARDALVEVVRMTLPLTGAPPRPDSSYRAAVRDRLQGGWWQWLVGRRARRGHSLLWALAGAAAAVLCFFLWPRDGSADPSPGSNGDGTNRVLDHEPGAVHVPDQDLGETAYVWAELNNTDHLERAVASEQKRRSRAEDRRLVRVPRRTAVIEPGGNH